MCGICGIASGRGVVDRERLGKMAATLVHRGPDSEGMHVEGPVGIAARRLAIIDLTGGDQPIANEDGSVVVVQNGEIYNYRELAHSLARAGHTFHTRSDTEVLVHGYEEWGAGVWERLRGMFAVAVWDARRGRLTLARDRFGIKPLYYRDQGGELSFASELDALPHGDVDLQALEAFLSFNVVPAPLSIFSDIRKLLPGHTLTWERGTSTLARFARPGPLPARHDEDEAELVEECRARLRDSVRAHLIADVPVGVLLSGGVDSGALAALAAEESSDAVRTFSIGFEEASFDELAGARAVSARYGTRAPARRRTAPAGPRSGVRRALRRLVRPTDLSRLEARGRGREGRAVGRGRRRALRRLLHLRRRSTRRACRPVRVAGPPAAGTAADLDAACQLRV
jgi:asparagine synthase (glutamine-hydrolysing)